MRYPNGRNNEHIQYPHEYSSKVPDACVPRRRRRLWNLPGFHTLTYLGRVNPQAAKLGTLGSLSTFYIVGSQLVVFMPCKGP